MRDYDSSGRFSDLLPDNTIRPARVSHGEKVRFWERVKRRMGENGMTEANRITELAEGRYCTAEEFDTTMTI